MHASIGTNWQSEYEAAVLQGNASPNLGTVTDAYGIVDRYGCQHLHIEFSEGETRCIYHEQSLDNTDDIDQIENDPEEWADNMYGATNWSEWTWYGPDSCPLC